jgi:hypothetical protein
MMTTLFIYGKHNKISALVDLRDVIYDWHDLFRFARKLKIINRK